MEIGNMEKLVLIILLILSALNSHSAFFFMSDLEIEMEKMDPPYKYLIEKLPSGLLDIEDLTNITILPTASTKDVTIYFYSRSNPEDPVKLNITDVYYLGNKTSFDSLKQSLFIIHGWHNNYSSPVNSLIKTAVLEKFDVNVFVVDWSPFSQKNYVTAFVNVPKVGQILGRFFKNISRVYDYPLNNIKVVGHSLGAHIAGIAGQETDGQLRTIVGLDPAGPLFTLAKTDLRLTKDDAKYVQVIHTCGKLLGFYPPHGDTDFYPNGGMGQPGCGFLNDIDGTCSHSRAYEYYAESISSGDFFATYCDNYYFSYIFGKCNENTITEMGKYHLDKTEGKFYLKTNSEPPYARQI